MAKTIAIMLDGGHVRVYTRKAGKFYNPDYIEKLALACKAKDEDIHRILYYDCAPYKGKVTLPVSGDKKQFSGSDAWLNELAERTSLPSASGFSSFAGLR